MKKLNLSFLLVAWVAIAVVACSCPAPTPTPTGAPAETPTGIPTAIPTKVPTATPTKAPTATSTETPTPTRTPTRTPRSTPWPTWTPSPTPTPTPPPSAIGPFRLVPQAEGRPQGEIWDLCAAPDGTLWLVTEEGVGSLHGGTWTLHLSTPGREYSYDYALAVAGFDNAGRTWLIIDEGNAIAAWDGISWITYGPETGWSPVSLYKRGWWRDKYDLVTDRRGWVWLVTNDDVRTFDGQTWTVYIPEEIGFAPDSEYGSPAIGLTSMALDNSGNVWVGGCYGEYSKEGPGARWFNGQEWQGADSREVGSGCVMDIEVDAAGNVWVGMVDGLWRYTSGEGWTRFITEEEDLLLPGSLPPLGITEIDPGPRGATLWISARIYEGCGGGPDCQTTRLLRFRVSDGTFSRVGWGLYDDLVLDAAGTAFFCSWGPIYHIVGATPELLAGLPADDIWAWCHVDVDSAGRVWAALDDWLWVYEGAGSE